MSNKKYWKSVEELKESSSIVDALTQNEFVEEIPTDAFLGDKETLEASSTTRRDFLKYVGFSTAAASLAACEGPVRKSIPYVIKPNDVIPGVADYYATTIANGFDFANILVKVREGRPIKINPNKEANGSTNARVQASVLSLYDSNRLIAPKANGENISWKDATSQIGTKLTEAATAGKQIVWLTNTDASPSTAKLFAEFKTKYPTAKRVIYDAVSEDAALNAFQQVHGKRTLPNYDFSKAAVIVSVGADFLGDWQGGGFEKDYAKARIPKQGKMSHHVQIESNMSLTGANADVRVAATSAQQKLALVKLYNAVVRGISTREASPLNDAILKVAAKIKKSGGRAVVITGLQDINAQIAALEINKAIASSVIDTNATKNVRQGNLAEVNSLIAAMNAGNVGVLMMANTNPLYTLANAEDFANSMKKVGTTVAFSMANDETAQAVQYALATPHYLESWGDAEIVKGTHSLIQPTIQPLFDTKQFQDVVLNLLGKEEDYYNYIKNNWSASVLEGKSWNQALHDGVFSVSVTAPELDYSETTSEEINTTSAVAAFTALGASKSSSEYELQLYTKTGMGDGQQASNPWLQEFPDPITRASWDNYLTVSQADATKLGAKNWHVADGALNGSLVEITVNGISVTLPVYILPGQATGTFGLALGYGRKAGIKEDMLVGKNAYHFYKDGNTVQTISDIKVVAGKHEFACVQLHNTMMDRGEIVKETTLSLYNDHSLDPKKSWNLMPMVSLDHNEVPVTDSKVDLWKEFDRSVGHHFNLSIDLNACTGCGACVIACHTENNVAVVGKAEVRKSRDMHWLRIDRYFTSDTHKDNEDLGLVEKFKKMEIPSENPQVVFQPVMCQHCNHAPCETVCPVAATSHGRQGQNQMAYNRCVGTRYCANNCPYKVRRFNWFDYANNNEFDFNMNDDLGKMVLNPDVVVRSRGVMEKCSLCIQMTQATILKAKKEGRPVAKDEFETACSNACSTGAMVFGDINNKEDEVTHLKEDKRAYHLLESIGTKPNVVYQVKVRNT